MKRICDELESSVPILYGHHLFPELSILTVIHIYLIYWSVCKYHFWLILWNSRSTAVFVNVLYIILYPQYGIAIVLFRIALIYPDKLTCRVPLRHWIVHSCYRVGNTKCLQLGTRLHHLYTDNFIITFHQSHHIYIQTHIIISLAGQTLTWGERVWSNSHHAFVLHSQQWGWLRKWLLT